MDFYRSRGLNVLFILCMIKSLNSADTCDKITKDCKKSVSCDYIVTPITRLAGAEIHGLNLANINQECANQIKQEGLKHRYLVFKRQSLSWQQQIKFTELFGIAHPTKTQRPHNSPDPRIDLYSNDPAVGLKGAKGVGWHVDGNTAEAPHLFTLLYCEHASRNGPTLLVPLKEIVDMLSQEEKSYLDTIHVVSSSNSSIVHPLLYKHPYRGDESIMLVLGSLSAPYLQDDPGNPEKRRVLSNDESDFIENLLESKILSSNMIYAMNYEPGDLLMYNDQSVGHISGPGTQVPQEVAGLRLIRRTSVRGESKPSKLITPNLDN